MCSLFLCVKTKIMATTKEKIWLAVAACSVGGAIVALASGSETTTTTSQ